MASAASATTSRSAARVTATITAAAGAFTTTLAPPPSHQVHAVSLLSPDHASPTKWDSANPIVLFIIQAAIIISLSAFLGLFLKKLRQPRVIAEVIGGIILGPTAMGRVPGFTANIFPTNSLPSLNLVANIGLVLFLFIVGLETDIGILRRNWRAAAGVGFIGLAIPFALGAAISKGLYSRYVDDSVEYGHFLLFIATAFAITAMPVLCRILTELKLLRSDVGLTTLAAGVFNDVVGWILLALAVTLVQAGSGITALYVLLVTIAWALFLVFVVRPAFIYLARRSGSFEGNGPSQAIMCLTLLITFASAWFTQVMGVHAIFGGFLAGIIMPHEHNFAAHMTAKIEDLVAVFFLPLYFALSGLSTDLGLLNNGGIWGWAVCVIVVAELSKFIPCFCVGIFSGKTWRESGAIGSLMACKGLVELIVLNIGLNAGILNPSIFAMFVLMALLTTFATTPLTLYFYPEKYRDQPLVESGDRGEKDLAPTDHGAPPGPDSFKSRYMVVLNRLEHLPSMMAFVKLLQTPVEYRGGYSAQVSNSGYSAEKEKGSADSITSRTAPPTAPDLTIDALRLVELGGRESDVMKATNLDEVASHDPLSQIFTTFGHLNGIHISSTLSMVLPEAFSTEIATAAAAKESDMVIVPWSGRASTSVHDAGPSMNPFEKIFLGEHGTAESSPQYAALVRSIFAKAICDVALYVEHGSGSISALTTGSRPWTGQQHVFLAFHGGPDDRAALDFVVRLCQHPGVTATVVRIIRTAEPTSEDDANLSKSLTIDTQDIPQALTQLTIHGRGAGADTVYGTTTPASRLQSETADNLIWAKYFPGAEGTEAIAPADSKHSPLIVAALSRISASVVSTSLPLRTTLKRAETAGDATSAPLLVVTGRSRRGAESHASELVGYLKDRVAGAGSAGAKSLGLAGSSEVRKTLGDIGSAAVAAGKAGAVLVVQAGTTGKKHVKQV